MKKTLIILFSLLTFAASAQLSVSNGQNIPFLAGEDVTVGDAIYLNQNFSPPKVYKANVFGSKKAAVGFCSKTTTTGDTTFAVLGGTIENFPFALTVGAKYYLSTVVPGEIRDTDPGSVTQAVGVAIDTYRMQVVLAPIRILEYVTPGLSDVTAINATTYNGIQFKGSSGDEGYVNLYVDPVSAMYDVKLPQATGTVALTSNIQTYTAGTGIAVSGSNVISNTAPDQTVALTNGGGITPSGTYPNFTLTATDQSITNELQTVANTSDATSHTVTLSNSGGSTQFVEGSGITLTTTGTSGAGIVTIAASGGGGSGDIVNGGNTTGATVVIGTNDANALSFETNNVVRQTMTGGASTGGAQTLTDVTANTATVENAITVRTNSSGTAATGFGAQQLYQLESTTTDNQDAGAVGAIWTTAIHASRTSAVQFSGVNNAGAIGEFARFEGATAPVLKISSAVGTPGTTTYRDNGITPGGTYALGNNSQTINVGGSSGTVSIGGGSGIVQMFSSASSGIPVLIASTNNSATSTMGVRLGSSGTTFTQTSGTRNVIDLTQNFAPTSGTAIHNQLSFLSTFNQTGGANGAINLINFDPTLTAVGGGISFLNSATSNAGAKFINQTGALTTNIFVGKTTHGATTAPTALLMLAAGTATANTSPLKFTSGTNLTAVENGAVEYDGTDYFVSSGGTRFVLSRTLRGSATLDFASTAAGTSTDLTLTVTGAADGDVVSIGVPNGSTLANGLFTAWVSAANTVTVRFSNNGLVSALDPSSGTFKATVSK